MKKIFLILLGINILALNSYSQQKIDEAKIPATVKSKFHDLFPNTKAEYWTMDEGSYVAEFDQQKKEMTVFIQPDGKVLKTETRIHPSGLPTEAKAYIAKHYPGKKITDCVTTADLEGHRIYEAEVNELDLIFDGNGKFIKSTKERPID